MKNTLLSFFLFLLLGCSPKLRSNTYKKLPALPDNELVVVLDLYDDQRIDKEIIGEIKITDNGFSEKCSYYEGIENLKKLSRNAGANLVKITKHKKASKKSTCNQFWAKVYKVEHVKEFENKVFWDVKRKLTWNDFKGKPNTVDFPNVLAITNSGFNINPSIRLFKNGKLFIETVFNTNESWVIPEGRNEYVLRHEQIHFDITEVYSRMLRKALIDSNITSLASGKAQEYYNSIFSAMKKRQNLYDYETKHGEKKRTQENWEAIIILELAKYDFYKSNTKQ